MSGAALATSVRLARWTLARCLPRAAWLLAGALLALGLAARAGAPEARLVPALESAAPHAPPPAPDVPTLVLAAVLAPFVLLRAATFGREWRERAADWLGALAVTRARIALGVAGGVVAALGVASGPTLGVAFVLAAVDDGPAPRWVRSLEHPVATRVDGDPPLVWSVAGVRLEDLARGSAFVLRPTVAPGSGPAVSLTLTLTDAGSASSVATARIHGRARVALDVPPDARGVPRFALARHGPGAVLALPRGALELRSPAGPYARLALPLAVAAAALAWSLLALGLGAWMRPALAAGCALALAALPWCVDVALFRTAWPGGGLPALVERGGEALVPVEAATWSAGAVVAHALPVALGVLATWCGLARGRGAS